MNDSGERELVLGNKQLLAIFFVAALLCGVFFAVGYVVGGNATRTVAVDGTTAPPSEGKREEPRPQTGDSAADATAARSASDTGGTLPAAEPRVADNPAAAGAQPLTPAPAPPAPVHAAIAPAGKPEAQAYNSAATGVFLSVPENGTSYWQVTAVRRPEADGVVKVLRERQFPAILAESSNPALFRVMVGPYRSTGAFSEAKRKLTELGYDKLIPHVTK